MGPQEGGWLSEARLSRACLLGLECVQLSRSGLCSSGLQQIKMTGPVALRGEGKGKGTTGPEFSTLQSARTVQKGLRSGVTGISVPGGTWFTDVGVRDAIKLGLMLGPRMYVAGRMIVTYGCIEDDEPSWEGTPDHSIGKLCNTADEMVTEVRR